MSNKYILILILAVILNACSSDKKPGIILGKSIDESTQEVKDVTDVFETTDTFAFSFSQKKPFTHPVINVRFYKGNDIYDMVQCTNDALSVNPETNTISKSLKVEYFAGKTGKGKYFIYFIINDYVIASKSFMVGKVDDRKEPAVERKPFTYQQPGGRTVTPNNPVSPLDNDFIPPVPTDNDIQP